MGYWDKEVEPFVHYLPVKADFSNLEETVRYVINPINAEHVASIVKNAQVSHCFSVVIQAQFLKFDLTYECCSLLYAFKGIL